LALSGGKHLARDNKTRWNSFDNMVTTALILKVHNALDRYIDLYGDTDDRVDRLTAKDWLELEQVINSYLNLWLLI
jgi:hypothetical protein